MLKLFKPSVILEDLGPLLQYLPVTLGIALVSIFFAFLLGFFVAMIKINKVPVLSKMQHSMYHLQEERRFWYSCICPTTESRSCCST